MNTISRLLARYPIIHRLAHRGPKDRACLVCRLVWFLFLREPGVRERLDAGRAELAAGKGVRYEVRDGDLFRLDASQ